jgi:hypothetical protein
MADRLLYHDLASLLGHLPNMEFGEESIYDLPRKWAVYELRTSNFARKVLSLVAYIYSDATKTDLQHLRAALQNDSRKAADIIVIAPPSYLERSSSLVKEILCDLSATILSSRDYLVSSFQVQLDEYLVEVKKASGPHYVDPIVATSTDVGGKRSGIVIRQFLEGKSTHSAMLGILLAEPGQGKTFFSGHLAATLATRGLVPLYVNSEHWKSMRSEELESIWKAIGQSFNAHGARISWIDGIEEEFISICQKANLFSIIFDGFDEFVLRNSGHVDAIECINALLDMARSSGARILVTARSSFWNSDVAPRLSESQQLKLFFLQPFDKPGANAYFAKRFPEDRVSAAQAARLFAQLSRSTTTSGVNFVGRGFFLYHIADLVERGFGEDYLDMGTLTSTQWLARKLCDREIARQNIPLTEDQQLRILSELGYFIVTGGITDTDAFKTIVLAEVQSLTTKQVEELIGVDLPAFFGPALS